MLLEEQDCTNKNSPVGFLELTQLHSSEARDKPAANAFVHLIMFFPKELLWNISKTVSPGSLPEKMKLRLETKQTTANSLLLVSFIRLVFSVRIYLDVLSQMTNSFSSSFFSCVSDVAYAIVVLATASLIFLWSKWDHVPVHHRGDLKREYRILYNLQTGLTKGKQDGYLV